MHLERFGSTEEIVRAKSELAQAIPPGGCWSSTPTARARCGSRKARRTAACCCTAKRRRRISRRGSSSIRFSKQGTTFVLRTSERDVRLLHAAARPADHPEPGRRVHAGDRARRRSGDRGRGAADAEAGVESARGRRGARRHLDSRRLQLESVRFPRRARSGGGAAGGAPVSGDARRHRAGAAAVRRQPSAVARGLARSATTRSIVAETNREAFVAGHRDAGQRSATGARAEPHRGVSLAARNAEGGRRRHSRERSAGSVRAERRRVLEGGRGDHERAAHRSPCCSAGARSSTTSRS